MGLFSALDIGKNAVLSQQRALQTVGNNIANATSEGYSRQRVSFQPIDSVRYGSFYQGLGVGLRGVTRLHDRAIEARLVDSSALLGRLERLQNTYSRVESAFNALGDNNLGTQLSRFFGAAADAAASPQDLAARRVLLQSAETLAGGFNALASSLYQQRALANDEVLAAADNVNRLTSEIAQLNDAIVRSEIGGTTGGQANDLRDRRDQRVRELAALADIRPVEQRNGSVDIVSGGNFLVRGFTSYSLKSEPVPDRGAVTHRLRFAESGQEFSPRAGTLGGLLESRDSVIPRFLGELDAMAREVVRRVNEAHTQGAGLEWMRSAATAPFSTAHALQGAPLAVNGTVVQGGESGAFLVDPSLRGYPASSPGGNADMFVGARVLFTSGARAGESALVSEYDPGTGRIGLQPPLPGISQGDAFQIGSFDHPLRHGSFELVIRNGAAGVETPVHIELDLDGLPTPPATDDTTLREMVEDINAQISAALGPNPPVMARITSDQRLEFVSTSPEVAFRFANDSSGFLAAAGLNTLFRGSNASDIALDARLRNRPELLALSSGGTPGDNGVASALAAIRENRGFAGGTATLEDFYAGMMGALGVQAAEANELAGTQALMQSALENERAAVSGVNLDEEAVALMTHQRAFQAAARYLSVVDSLMQSLIQTL